MFYKAFKHSFDSMSSNADLWEPIDEAAARTYLATSFQDVDAVIADLKAGQEVATAFALYRFIDTLSNRGRLTTFIWFEAHTKLWQWRLDRVNGQFVEVLREDHALTRDEAARAAYAAYDSYQPYMQQESQS